ncbi:MAG: DUF2179 domain-containing protein [Bacteroidales bacterium]
MFDSAFFQSPLFSYFILPSLIFFIRIVDVTFDTLRIVYISRGNKLIAPILGFFGVLVWLLAITQIMQHLDNFICYVAYAGGFATGNLIGLVIEERLALGFQIVRVITTLDATPLQEDLRQKGFGVTSIEAQGKSGKVNILYSIVKRSNTKELLDTIHEFNPSAFYSIEDIRALNTRHSFFGPDFKKTNRYRWFKRGRQTV